MRPANGCRQTFHGAGRGGRRSARSRRQDRRHDSARRMRPATHRCLCPDSGSFLAELVASIGRAIPISTSKSRRAPLAAGHRPPARPRGHGRRAGRIGVVAVGAAKGAGIIVMTVFGHKGMRAAPWRFRDLFVDSSRASARNALTPADKLRRLG